MTTSSDAPGESPQEPPALWIPLEDVAELCAAFGKDATNASAFKATSAAFAALAEEHEALHLTRILHERRQRVVRAEALDLPLHPVGQDQSIIEYLTRAASFWFDAACTLSTAAQTPSSSDVDMPSSNLDIETLIGYTLAQRERVWAIAHALLLEQLRPYHVGWEQGSSSISTLAITRSEGARPQ